MNRRKQSTVDCFKTVLNLISGSRPRPPEEASRVQVNTKKKKKQNNNFILFHKSAQNRE